MAGPTINAPVDPSSPNQLEDLATSPAPAGLRGRIGPYRLLECIGEGGFGEVWTAEQMEPMRRKVALKILKAGMDSKEVLARFEAERQALAMMDHPNVARVYDAGATDAGRPYFVMEHVAGVPITDFCDAGRLPVRRRLALFIQVCDAVQHAHSKGIIHRDLKPSNILVTLAGGESTANASGVPKVIDFGIAKATRAPLTDRTLLTQAGQLMGTPEYMSPEQAGSSGVDVDTRSDVYSLGVILYQLLTGTLPFDARALREAGYDGLVKIIREMQPPKPSTRLSTLGSEPVNQGNGVTPREIAGRRHTDFAALQRQVRGELDWIVLRCLEKDRARRYATANGLAMDVGRHLAGEPVVAAPPSRAYRLRKFTRRNRGTVVAGALVACALLIGFGVAVWQAVRAQQAADLAEQRRKEAEQIAEFQASQLRVNVKRMGNGLRGDIEKRLRAALELDGMDEAEIEAAVADLERWHAHVNFTDVATESLRANIIEDTLAAIEGQFADQPLVRAQLLASVARTMRRLQMFEAAIGPAQRAREIRERELGLRHPDTLRSMNQTGVLRYEAEHDDAVEDLRETVEIARRTLGGQDRLSLSIYRGLGEDAETKRYFRLTLDAIHLLGIALLGLNDIEAEQCFREVVEVGSQTLGDDDIVLSARLSLGVALRNLGRTDEAEAVHREILDEPTGILGPDAGLRVMTATALGHSLNMEGEFEEAERYLRDALEGSRSHRGDEHWRTALSMAWLGSLLRDRGELDESERLLAEAVRSRPDRRGVMAADYRRYHGFTLTALRRFEEAEAELRTAQELLGYQGAPVSKFEEGFEIRTFWLACTFVQLYDTWHDDAPNAGYDARAAEWWERQEATQTPGSGVLYYQWGGGNHFDEYFDAVVEVAQQKWGVEDRWTLNAINRLGLVLHQQGRFVEAEQCFREVVEVGSRVFGTDDRLVLAAMGNLAASLAGQDRWDEAEAQYRDTRQACARILGSDHTNTLWAAQWLGVTLHRQGKLEDAEPYLRETLERYRERRGDGWWRTAMAMHHLGELLRDRNQLEEAERLGAEAVRHSPRTRDRRPPLAAKLLLGHVTCPP